MMRFANPHIFWLLSLVVVLVALFIYGVYVQRRRLRQFGNPELLRTLMPNVSYIRPQLKFYLLAVALVLIVFALARPQIGSRLEKSDTTGIEVMMVLDVSNSMLATDVAPSRIENAKMMLSKLIDQMPDNKVGLIVFSGDAVVQLPMTADNVSAKMFLSTITTKSVANPGTAVGTALDLAIKSFGEENKDIGRSIILLTDGENHEDDAVAAAKLAREKGIMVNVVGFGSPQGSPIPVQGTMSFWKDKEGNVVVSKLNEQMCQQIAQAGDGVYVRADNSNIALRTISKQLTQLQQGEIQSAVYADYADRFYIFAWIALFILIIEFFILNRQNKQLNKYKWFE
ncbi:MAG: VWA domain-containing protein [Paludibacteraceae bacterium]|nr:VWA domain-containing protein [Paludibacteraceae bacterium]